jgi:hypothetical protein
MDAAKLTAIISLILALSVASERLVEIVKGFIPPLTKPLQDPHREAIRCSVLQILAVLSGVVTSYLARDYIPQEVSDVAKGWSVWGLGLLASGGSGLWNSILTYFLKIKDIKAAEAEVVKASMR